MLNQTLIKCLTCKHSRHVCDKANGFAYYFTPTLQLHPFISRQLFHLQAMQISATRFPQRCFNYCNSMWLMCLIIIDAIDRETVAEVLRTSRNFNCRLISCIVASPQCQITARMLSDLIEGNRRLSI